MKIGILTFHRTNNYGAVLQNFALIKTIENSGLGEVHDIDFRDSALEKPYEVTIFPNTKMNPVKAVYNTFHNLRFYRRRKRGAKAFDAFRHQYLNMTKSYTAEELSENAEPFDIYITGSDQIWNKNIVNRNKTDYTDMIFSLGFVRQGRKIAFAASAGNVEYIDPEIMQYISSIDEISVREKSLYDYLHGRLNHKKIYQVSDPVFLLDRNEWNSFLPPERAVRQKYILIYCVGVRDEVIRKAKVIAKKNHCKIVYLDYRYRIYHNGICICDGSPFTFVQLIRDAECVIASSFHATAFSIIFEKPFLTYSLAGSGIFATGSRIVGLLNHYKLQDRLTDPHDDELSEVNMLTEDLKNCQPIVAQDRVCASELLIRMLEGRKAEDDFQNT